MKFKSGNHALDATYSTAADGGGTTKRELVYDAVRRQIEQDNRRPWLLGQKLNEAPYRYTRDTLWSSLLSVSKRLRSAEPRVNFEVEDRFQHRDFPSFASFVNKRLTGTVSELINGIVEASRL